MCVCTHTQKQEEKETEKEREFGQEENGTYAIYISIYANVCVYILQAQLHKQHGVLWGGFG